VNTSWGFGGPHEVFTRGYAQAGVSANHLQVYFTEAARAYMRAPYTFIKRHVSRKDATPWIKLCEFVPCITHDSTTHVFPELIAAVQTVPEWPDLKPEPLPGYRRERSGFYMLQKQQPSPDKLDSSEGLPWMPQCFKALVPCLN
jgi:hypothetical protein